MGRVWTGAGADRTAVSTAPTYASTAGENSAPATPMIRTAATNTAGVGANASSTNPAARTAHPDSRSARGPKRSASAPPTRKSPCCTATRAPTMAPMAAGPSPKRASARTAMNGTTLEKPTMKAAWARSSTRSRGAVLMRSAPPP